MAINQKTVSIGEAAVALGIGRNTAYKLARQGQLPGVIGLGKRMVVSRAVLEDVLGAKLDAGQERQVSVA
jgi:excisionase family DNA binding protein